MATRRYPTCQSGPTLPAVSARAQSASGVAEPDDDAPGGVIVAYYRLDPSRSLRRALGWGAFIVTLGAFVMALAILLPRLSGGGEMHTTTARAAVFRGSQVTADGTPIVSRTSTLELGLGVFGLLCIATGGATAIVGLRRVLTEESYLALRTDGAYFRRGDERALCRWEDVEEVRWMADARALWFIRHEGPPWIRAERFAGVEGAELAKRASEIRRKALFGLLG